MSAQEQMKKMLDELMGTQRDGEKQDEIKFNEDRVCKSFLMGLCPNDLFSNTKMDLGECSKFHSLALKADFELASKDREYGYDVNQMEHLQAFIRECDRKIQIAKKRLEETQDENEKTPEAQAAHELVEQIGKKLADAEKLGAEGKVEESMVMMREVEELKEKKRLADMGFRADIFHGNLPTASMQQQKLRVCEVCAAYLSLYDNDRRLADHFGGKLHMGFIKIRDRLAELQQSVADKRAERDREREQRREEREKEREAERKAKEKEREKRLQEYTERNRRDRDRDRDRNRDRDSRRRSSDRRRRRSRSRSRGKSRDRSRERSRGRGKRNNSRSHSQSKSRSKSRSPKPRSGTKKRSNSRSRSRSRSRS